MGRWSLFLLGGDVNDPNVRRMFWRVTLASFIYGLAFGATAGAEGERAAHTDYLMAAATLAYVGFTIYEAWRYYQGADEMVKHICDRSLAVGGLIVLVATLTYGVLAELIGLREIEVLHIGLFALGVKLLAWMAAVWSST